MALLHIMMQMKVSYNMAFDVSVVHFNHMRRTPQEAELEQTLVQFWSEKFYKVPYHYRELGSSDSDVIAKRGFQEGARNWRRSECLKIIHLHHGNNTSADSSEREYCITTGHHLDDQVESVLMKLLRGTHISRLTPVGPLDCMG
jgi:tRNA(Ile)-lysidine synthase